MALTPDDVVTKQFQHVRFKDGFDPDEVDDFLDEVVLEWRKALDENAELKAKLAAYESGEKAAPAAEAPAAVAPTPVAAPVDIEIRHFHLFAGLGGLPPTRIDVGSEEILFSDAARLETRLREAGVPAQRQVWDGLWHDFQLLAGLLPEAERSILALGAFLREALAQPPAEMPSQPAEAQADPSGVAV